MVPRDPDVRVRVTVRGPDVHGIVTARDVELYIVTTGWKPFYVTEADPVGWRADWPEDLATSYQYDGQHTVGSPLDPRERLGRIITQIGIAERREPSEVLRRIEALGRARGR